MNMTTYVEYWVDSPSLYMIYIDSILYEELAQPEFVEYDEQDKFDL